MSNCYSVFGTQVAQMRGRRSLFAQVVGELTKPTPSNVSLVGPRYIGKTVLINALIKRFNAPGSEYRVVVYWDLRDGVPDTDGIFYEQLCMRLRGRLHDTGLAKYVGYLPPGNSDVTENIDLVLSSLQDDGVSVLIALDHFDRILYATELSRNLWDYLASLIRRSNFRLITASRSPVNDLVPTTESKTSYFWELLGAPVYVRPFSIDEVDEFAEPLTSAGVTLGTGCQKQVIRLTGGIPVLMAALFDAAESAGRKDIPPEWLRTLLESDEERFAHLCEAIWQDCPAAVQDDLTDLVNGDATLNSLSPLRQAALKDRGFVHTIDRRASVECELLQSVAKSYGAGAYNVRKLLDSPESEAASFRKILELKLDRVIAGDQDLKKRVQLAVRGLDETGNAAVGLIRDIAKNAVHVAWNVEFPGGKIPRDRYATLADPIERGGAGINQDWLSKEEDVFARRNILRAMCGDDTRPRITKRISRPVVLMIDFLYNAGNFAAHALDKDREQWKREGVDFGLAVVLLSSAVELFRRLVADASNPDVWPRTRLEA